MNRGARGERHRRSKNFPAYKAMLSYPQEKYTFMYRGGGVLQTKDLLYQFDHI